MFPRRWALVLGVIAAFQVASRAATYVVNPDGTGDAPTIGAAVSRAVTGDVVLLADGVFQGPGNRDILCREKAIEIRSANDDPSACIIDCQGSASEFHRGFEFRSIPSPGATLQGVTITNAHAGYGGGGARCWPLTTVIFRNCIFRSNRDESGSAGGGWGGGGVVGGAIAYFYDCVFEDNGANGGGAFAGSTGVAAFERCTFSRNVGSEGGGACYLDLGSTASFTDCLFQGNQSQMGGAVYCESDGQVTLDRCTMVGNSASVFGSCFFGYNGGAAFVNRSILAFGEGCSAVWGEINTTAQLTCCDVYGNEGGDWVNGIEEQAGTNGNLCLDPLFCSLEENDFGLHTDSPCASDFNPACGLIGALPIGCGDSPTQQRTWGAMKALFRGDAK